jgi:hypothetical protein
MIFPLITSSFIGPNSDLAADDSISRIQGHIGKERNKDGQANHMTLFKREDKIPEDRPQRGDHLQTCLVPRIVPPRLLLRVGCSGAANNEGW